MVVTEQPTHTVGYGDVTKSDNTTSTTMDGVGDMVRTYSNMAERTNLVANINWTNSQAPSTVLYRVNAPFNLLNSKQQRMGFENMTYWKGKMDLSIFPHTNAFQAGSLGVAFVPNINVTDFDARITGTDALRWLTTLTYTKVDASNPQAAHLLVPFMHPYNALDLSLYDGDPDENCTLGVFVVFVLAQLSVAENTTPSASVSIYAAYPESQFFVPRPVPIAINEVLELSEKRRKTNALIRQNKVKVHGMNAYKKNVAEEKTHGSNFLKALSEASKRVVLRAVDKLEETASSFVVSGLDATPIPVAQSGFVPMPFSSLNLVDQPRLVDPLSLSSNCMSETKVEMLGIDVDENDGRMLMKRPLLVTGFSWADTSLYGTQLFTLPISPMMCSSTRTTSDYQPGWSDWLADQAAYWRGNIKVAVQVVAPKFIGGTLQVSMAYDVFSATMGVTDANQGFSKTLDLGELQTTRETTFEVPYMASYPAKRCNISSQDLMTVEEKLQAFLGTMYFHVINPLNVSSGSPNSVRVLIFLDASDVVFYGFKESNIREYVPESTHGPTYLLGPRTADIPLSLSGLQAWCSFRDLAKRKTLPVNYSSGNHIVRMNELTMPGSLTHNLQCFKGWRGGIEANVYQLGSVSSLTATTQFFFTNSNYTEVFDSDGFGTLYSTVLTNIQGYRGLLLPFSAQTRYVITGSLDNNPIIHNAGTLIIVVGVNAQVTLYFGAADDFRYVAPIGPPYSVGYY